MRILFLTFLLFATSALAQQTQDTISFEPAGIYIPNVVDMDSTWIPCKVNSQTCNFEDFDLKIFNRWGELMFESNDPNQGWTPKSNQTAEGIYVWVIKGVKLVDTNGDALYDERENVEYKGHFTVLN